MRSLVVVFAVAVAEVLGGAAAFAQPLAVPPGAWWDRPKLAEVLGLTAEQKSSLEKVSLEHARGMVDLQGAVRKAELDLRAAAEATPFDATAVRAAFHTYQQARVKLDAERFELLRIGEDEGAPEANPPRWRRPRR